MEVREEKMAVVGHGAANSGMVVSVERAVGAVEVPVVVAARVGVARAGVVMEVVAMAPEKTVAEEVAEAVMAAMEATEATEEH